MRMYSWVSVSVCVCACVCVFVSLCLLCARGIWTITQDVRRQIQVGIDIDPDRICINSYTNADVALDIDVSVDVDINYDTT